MVESPWVQTQLVVAAGMMRFWQNLTRKEIGNGLHLWVLQGETLVTLFALANENPNSR